MPVPIAQMTLLEMLLLVALPGLFGGFVSSIYEFLHFFKKSLRDESSILKITQRIPYSKFQAFCLCVARALVGVVGAFGAVLLLSSVGKITSVNTVDNQLFLIGLNMVAGLLSYQYLPIIGTKVAKQLLALEQKTDDALLKSAEANSRALTAIEDSSNASQFTGDMSFAETCLNGSRDGSRDSEVPTAIERLSKWLSIYPYNRTLHIFLGRLYRVVPDLGSAIIILTQFINNMEHKATESEYTLDEKKQISDAYFNIACYSTLRADCKVAGCSDIERDAFLRDALKALKASVKWFEGNKASAKTDPDFNMLKTEMTHEFNMLVDI